MNDQTPPRVLSEPGIPILEGVNWGGLKTLYITEVRRFFKVHMQTVWAPAITTLLYLVIFTVALGRSGKSVRGVPVADFIAPAYVQSRGKITTPNSPRLLYDALERTPDEGSTERHGENPTDEREEGCDGELIDQCRAKCGTSVGDRPTDDDRTRLELAHLHRNCHRDHPGRVGQSLGF